MKFRLVALSAALIVPFAVQAADPVVPAYRKVSLSDVFFSEGAAFGDMNNDGQLDVVSGPYWYAAPDFKTRHDIYLALPYDPLKYSDNFFAFTYDFNHDGWTDVLVIGFPGVDASWYANPGAKGGPWRRNVVMLPVDNESPTFGALFGKDQPPALVCMSRGRVGYATFNAKDAVLPWVFHAVSPQGNYQRFTHGLGFGDVNGDGRNDILEKDGWWEQPATLTGDPEWKQHKFAFAGKDRGGAQMHVFDVNGDGRNDVIASRNAHGLGLSWWEQIKGADGEISFREHPITSHLETELINGVQFSQQHAMELADFDGDGLLDIVTGKRWWAHGPTGDVQPTAAPVLYVFLLRRAPDGTATYVPHLIDDTTGVGTQVVIADANRDGKPDILVGNKRGTAVLLSQKP